MSCLGVPGDQFKIPYREPVHPQKIIAFDALDICDVLEVGMFRIS
jgi:hypothetical protein